MTTLTSVLQRNAKSATQLVVYIGRSLNPRCFLTNNRLFFDFLIDYLPKNGWSITDQILHTEMKWSRSRSLLTETKRGSGTCMGFQVPVAQSTWFEEHTNEKIDRYSGSYLDAVFHSYNVSTISSQSTEWIKEFHENRDRIFSAPTEEHTIYTKQTCPVRVQMSVVKAPDASDNSYSVQLLVNGSLDGYAEETDALVAILEMAMARYKKMDYTGPGITTSS